MPLCFAIMPITTPTDFLERYGKDPHHFIKVARHIFKPAAEAAGFDFKEPASTSAEVIQAEIIANLGDADIVLCDVSTWNANVFFELGIRVALNRPVAMVRDNLTDRLPFDNSIVNTHMYEASLQIDIVEQQVPRLTAFLDMAASQTQNALWKHFGITQRAKESDPGNPESAKLDLLLAEVSAIRRQQSARPGDRHNIPTTQVLRILDAALVGLDPATAGHILEPDDGGRMLNLATSEQLDGPTIEDFITAVDALASPPVEAIQFWQTGTGRKQGPYKTRHLIV